MIPNESQWYALHVKPHKERAVYEQLLARDITSYYPHIRVKPKNPRSRKERAYFPGYLFVHINLVEYGINALSWIPGSHRLVEFGGIPSIVPDTLIQQVQQAITTYNQELDGTLKKFKKGDRITIVDGVFDGYEAIFDTYLKDSSRVQILLTFLSDHPQPVHLNIDTLIKAK